MSKLIKLTGKLKKLECVKGTDRLVIENINIPDGDAIMALKGCANKEEAVENIIKPLQEKLPGCE